MFRIKRHRRIRAKIVGTKDRPRLSVYRSNKHLFLQLIDDDKRKTLISVSDRHLQSKKKNTKSDLAYEAGKVLAKKAAEAGITKIVFDRGGYQYHGRVEKIAKGARDGGLIF